MSSFKLPLISPLAGTTLPNLARVLKGKRVAPRYYFKLGITFIFVIVSSGFHWMDRVFLGRKVKNYSFSESPVFIIGHWRSGTTFLHNLLAQDPASGTVSTYQAVFPNNLKSAWLFKTFMRIFMPRERPGDEMPISVNLPQEEEYAMSNLTHRSFYHFFYFPSNYGEYYRDYVRFAYQGEDQKDAWKLDYRKMLVKALISSKGRRPLLKNPVNTGRIRMLVDLFPDAEFLFMVRNPVIVYLSSKKFFSGLFPTINLEKYTTEEISAMILDLYERFVKDYISDKKFVLRGKIREIRYEDFELDPMETVRNIYADMAPGEFEKVKPKFEAYLSGLDNQPCSAYKISRQELNLVMDRMKFAMDHWDYAIPDGIEILDV